MKPQRVYPKEKILDAAFDLTRRAGWEGVTARSVARKLGSSTMPIYSSLRSMQPAEAGVRQRAEQALREMQKRTYTGNAALDMAIGYVEFARQEPHLFRFLYQERPRRMRAPELEQQAAEFRSGAGGTPALKEMLAAIPELGTNPIILKSWIFVHGLATLVCSGALDLPEERVRELLQEAGAAFVTHEIRSKEAKSG